MPLLEREESKLLLADATVTASTVHGCRQRVTAFLQRYLPCFYRREQREHAGLVLRGKLSRLERKTSEPIARQAGLARRPVQAFVGAGQWDDESVMSELRQHVAEQFHDPEASFVVDGSAFPKKGTESCGVKRQWCGRLGKVDNCQVGVFLSCVSGGRAAPLDRRLYLPREWANHTARRRKCHVPPSLRFAEKWQLALKQIETARDLPHGWIVADDEFGRVVEFRAKLRKLRERYVLDVPSNTLVRVMSAAAAVQPPATPSFAKPKRRGRPPLPRWVRVDEWAAQQTASRWRRIEVLPGEKGPLIVEVLEAEVLTDTQGTRERLLVLRTVEAQPQTHYSLSNAAATVPVEQLVWAHDDRHRIEELFAVGNGEVGLDHYEVRSWVGWHHHMTLSLLAVWFLTLEQQRVGEKNTGDHSAPSAGDLQPPAAASRADVAAHRRDDHDRTAA